ncbi:MAG: PIN domain-containing protein [Mycobacteriales bacterium]
MIIIDTNVIAEMMREEPDPKVLAWAATAGRLHTTAISVAEVGYGIARLPGGRRRDQLAATAAKVFADFDEVIVSFDARVARHMAGSSPAVRRRAVPSLPPTRRSPRSVFLERRGSPRAAPLTSTPPASARPIPGKVHLDSA